MIASETASIDELPLPVLDSELRLTTPSLCPRTPQFRKPESMKSVVHEREKHRFRSLGGAGVSKALPLRLGWVSQALDTEPVAREPWTPGSGHRQEGRQ
ncbi:predicted protein [Streptomyces sp. SPB78]|nr:predicted protein [Streptomyces sp. SPB78]